MHTSQRCHSYNSQAWISLRVCSSVSIICGTYDSVIAEFSSLTSHFSSPLFFCFGISAQFSPSGSQALCVSLMPPFYTQKSPTVITVVSKQAGDSRQLTSELLLHRWDTNIYPYLILLGTEGLPRLEKNSPDWLEYPLKTKPALILSLLLNQRYTSMHWVTSGKESSGHSPLLCCTPWRVV